MNSERLFAHYDQIADAPDAVKRLRHFVLHLAVRGKLVPQYPNDEPASELLKKIEKHRENVEGARRNSGDSQGRIKVLAGDGLPFSLPSGWAWVVLGDIVISRDGERVPVSKQERECRAKLFDYYGASGVIDKIDSYLFDKPLLLVGEDGANLINRSTPIAFIARGKYWVNNHAHVLDGICEEFLRYLELFINAIDLKPYVTGTAQPKMNQAKMNSIPVALPPLAEQLRIVAKVDALMALSDRLEAARTAREARRDRLTAVSLSRLNTPDPDTFQHDTCFVLDALPVLTTRPDQITQLRQTILNLAVRGKLVPQDPETSPAAQTQSPVDKSTDGLPPAWHRMRLKNVLRENTQNGYSRRPDEAMNGTPILRISAGTARRDGIVAEEEHKLISGINAEVRSQYGLHRGDLLACRFNGNKAFVGRMTLFKDYLGIAPIYPDKLIRVRVSRELMLPEFLKLASESSEVRSEIEAMCATTVGNWGISASNLKEVRFPVPPLGEQHRIIAKVDELMALCDRLEASLSTTAEGRRRLLDALVAEAVESGA